MGWDEYFCPHCGARFLGYACDRVARWCEDCGMVMGWEGHQDKKFMSWGLARKYCWDVRYPGVGGPPRDVGL